jgi:hypothetical protein
MNGLQGMTLAVALLLASQVQAQQFESMGFGENVESPRYGQFAVKLGPYRPLIDSEDGLTGTPYEDTFGKKAMLLVELDYEHMVFQAFGNAGVGLGIGYAEKYGNAIDANTGEPSAELTSLKVLPTRVYGFYRFDWAAREFGVPLVPYGKLSLIYVPWWISKGGDLEQVAGGSGAGGRWGYGFTGGLAFQLDVLEPRLQRDFDAELGVNHTYVFAEYTLDEVTGFGTEGFNLSSRRFSFGLGLEF